MAIGWDTELSAGDWLSSPGTHWWQVVCFGPDVFDAYARVRFVPDPVHPRQAESDHDLPDSHPSDLDQTRRALRVLAAHTSTPDDCWFAVWEGYAGSIEIPAGLPLLELPHRRFGLLRGGLDELDGWEEAVGGALAVGPAFAWPSDRRWCFASDVDPHWAGVGGDTAAIEALLTDPALDVVRADPAARQPSYS